MLRAFLSVGDVCGYDSCGLLFVSLRVISWIALVSAPEYDPRNDTKQHKTEIAKQTDADFPDQQFHETMGERQSRYCCLNERNTRWATACRCTSSGPS